MGWSDLLQDRESKQLPWLGSGRSLHSSSQQWAISGKKPREYGWYEFEIKGRNAILKGACESQPEILVHRIKGYLVGDRIVPDGARVDPSPENIIHHSEKVFLIEEGLDRFVRVSAGRIYPEGPLIYYGLEFPEGPEDDVLNAFLDQKPSVTDIKGVAPALDAAFRMETWHRDQAEKVRAELARRRAEEEARRQEEERRQQLRERLGDGAMRREIAKVDFTEAARAALAIGGAELLDVRDGRRGEKVVRYRLDGRRFECICSEDMQICDAGICLTDHYSGEKGDTYFTLESLPGVIREATQQGVLVVFRHV